MIQKVKEAAKVNMGVFDQNNRLMNVPPIAEISQELNLTETRTFAGFSAGFGLKMGRFKFDYAYTKYHPVSNSNTISLLIDLTRTGF